jgi:hypothetical protein
MEEAKVEVNEIDFRFCLLHVCCIFYVDLLIN